MTLSYQEVFVKQPLVEATVPPLPIPDAQRSAALLPAREPPHDCALGRAMSLGAGKTVRKGAPLRRIYIAPRVARLVHDRYDELKSALDDGHDDFVLSRAGVPRDLDSSFYTGNEPYGKVKLLRW